MKSKTHRVLAITLIFLVATTLTASAKGDYVIKVMNENVGVHISGDLVQGVPNTAANNTADIFKSFPSFKIHLSDQNSSIVSTPLNIALQHFNLGGAPKQITLDSNSNGTLIHYDLRFSIEGLSRTHGVAETIDLSWKSFVIPDDFKAGNVTLNGALGDYLGERISFLAREPPSTGPPLVQRKLWYWNGNVILQDEVIPTIANLMILNFTGLSKPLQTWSASADLKSHSYQYQASTGFNLTRVVQVFEPEATTNFVRDVIYKVKTVVDAPWGTVASGDTLILESQGGWATLVMIVAILASSGLLVFAFLYERHVHESREQTRNRKVRK